MGDRNLHAGDPHQPGGVARLTLRALGLATVAAAGLLTLVGSGGGGALGFPPCPESLCPNVPPSPTVTILPRVFTAQVGTVAVFDAVVANASGAQLQWQRSTDGGATYQSLPGKVGPTLTVGPVNLADEGASFRATIPGNNLVFITPARLAVSTTPGVVFADGELLATNWSRNTVALFNQTTDPQTSDERVDTGGDPGAYRRMTTQLSSPGGLAATMYLWQGSEYDPRVQGAIRHIDHNESCLTLNPSDVRGTYAHAALEQGGRRYESNLLYSPCLTNRWQSASLAALQAGDYRLVAGPACSAGQSCPDFSATADPIRFGHVRRNSGQAADTIVHGVDNWRVTVWRR